MIKFGIHAIEQLKQGRMLTNVLGAERNISITLYDRLLQMPDADAWTERVLLLFPDGRGAYKRTYAHRFEEFDRQVIRMLRERRSAGERARPFLVHDVGVSDGRTSCDFFGKLATLEPDLLYHASDYDPEVFILASGHTRITIDREERLLEIVWPPFVFNVLNDGKVIKHPRYYLYPVNNLVKWWLTRTVVRTMLADYRAGRTKARCLTLFCPRALRLAGEDPRFVLGRYDILEPSPLERRVDVLRAMNVLNPSYFPADQFHRALGHFFAALAPGGLLVTGSNQASGSLVDGGVYERGEAGFRQVWTSGGGSPIHGLITSFAP